MTTGSARRVAEDRLLVTLCTATLERQTQDVSSLATHRLLHCQRLPSNISFDSFLLLLLSLILIRFHL